MDAWRYVKYKDKQFDLIKIVFAILTTIYFFYYAYTSAEWHFLDNVSLIIHEAGHPLMSVFGRFFQVAGGSGFQILIPIVFCLYFTWQEQYYSASILLFWVGQNFISVSVYASDAVKMQLPLLGGDSSGHDWNYLLSVTNLLEYTSVIADILYFIGLGLFVFASYFAILASEKKRDLFGFE